MKSILVDTTIFISSLRGYQPAQDFLVTHLQYVMSYITYGELLQGVKGGQDLKRVVEIAEKSRLSWGSESIHKRACDVMKKYKLSYGIGFFDALIAATAIEEHLTLVTDNLKHFKVIKELDVKSPY